MAAVDRLDATISIIMNRNALDGTAVGLGSDCRVGTVGNLRQCVDGCDDFVRLFLNGCTILLSDMTSDMPWGNGKLALLTN
jgi:hypothetical protein